MARSRVDVHKLSGSTNEADFFFASLASSSSQDGFDSMEILTVLYISVTGLCCTMKVMFYSKKMKSRKTVLTFSQDRSFLPEKRTGFLTHTIRV